MSNLRHNEGENESFLLSSTRSGYTDENFTADQQSDSIPLKDLNRSEATTTRLESSSYVLFLALAYTFLALFAWVVTCVLTYRPIGVSEYGFQWNASYVPESRYQQTTDWFKASRVVQSIVSVLTVPLASAVCSKAVVLYSQNSGQRKSLTMRQTIVLADKGWTNPATWINLLWYCWAGAVSSPLQELFLTQKPRKMPSSPQYLSQMTEIADLFDSEYHWGDTNYLTALTRSAMTSTVLPDIQSRLWQSDPVLCVNSSVSSDPNFSTLVLCTAGGVSLGNMTKLRDPFLAPLSANFSTGLIRQFSPRINSSSRVSSIANTEFPIGCSSRQGSFFAQYANAEGYRTWNIDICMPENYSNTPIRNTRMRQDFSESLYVNISLNGFFEFTSNISALYRVDLDTTIGYFELPNYMNGLKPGPLLTVDPESLCIKDCNAQGWRNNSITPHRKRAASGANASLDTSLTLERLVNKPPLLTIAMALFGEGSYLAERVAHPSGFFYVKNETLVYIPQNEQTSSPGACIGTFPWVPLINQADGTSTLQNVATCLTNAIYDEDDLTYQIGQYLLSFIPSNAAVPVERLENAFNAAAFLSNEAWLVNNPSSMKQFQITFDLGQDVQAPQISLAGMIVVSIVLGTFLANLLAVAIYSCWYPRWTGALDAFAMMRIGATMHEHLSLNYLGDVDKLRVLEETSGYIGDIAPLGADVGQLGIGGETPLKRRRQYWSDTG